MAITIGSNIASLQAQRRLEKSSNALGRAYERLASGARINHASDDPAGLSVSLSLGADIRVFNQARRNIGDGVSMLTIAEGALTELSSIVTRQLELAEQAANGVYSTIQRQAMNREANALVEEYNRIVSTTEFNGISLLDPAESTETVIQIGYGTTSTLRVDTTGLLDRAIGLGTFAAETTYAAGVGADVELADFNRDGNLDIMSSSGHIMIGNGNGTFRAAVSIYNIGGNGYLDSADFNGDGKLDLLFSLGGGGSNVNVMLGAGDGSFGPIMTFAAGTTPKRFAIADYNGDGKLDFATVNGTTLAFNVVLGNGDGTFVSPTSYSPGTGLFNFAIATADVNGDDISDIVTGHLGVYSVSLGNSNGSFRAALTISNPSGSSDVLRLGDINGDGYLDIVASDYSNGGFTTLFGNGNGTFRRGASFSSPSKAEGLELRDFTGDGILDVVLGTAYSATHQFGIAVGNGDGTFKSTVVTTTAADPYEVEAGDLNGDGVLDFISSNFGAANVSVFIQNTVNSSTVPRLDLLTKASARGALDDLRVVLGRVIDQRGALGVALRRLETANSNLASTVENYHAAAGRILDADIAAEAAERIRSSILQSAATAVLSQANQMPALALRLLQG